MAQTPMSVVYMNLHVVGHHGGGLCHFSPLKRLGMGRDPPGTLEATWYDPPDDPPQKMRRTTGLKETLRFGLVMSDVHPICHHHPIPDVQSPSDDVSDVQSAIISFLQCDLLGTRDAVRSASQAHWETMGIGDWLGVSQETLDELKHVEVPTLAPHHVDVDLSTSQDISL